MKHRNVSISSFFGRIATHIKQHTAESTGIMSTPHLTASVPWLAEWTRAYLALRQQLDSMDVPGHVRPHPDPLATYATVTDHDDRHWPDVRAIRRTIRRARAVSARSGRPKLESPLKM